MPDHSAVYRFGNFVLDSGQRRLHRDEVEIELQPKVFDTLAHLIRHADRVVPKDELLDRVWAGAVVTDNVLARVVSLLRKALADGPQQSKIIRAVQRVGYQFVAEVQVKLAGPAGSWERHPVALAAKTRTLAVLPFGSRKQDAADESLELGIADTLIARLSRVRDLIVRPMSAVRAFSEPADPVAFARSLQAEYFLEGSIQRHDDSVRITARLVSVADQVSHWSETFDEPFADIFALYDAICERIVSQLLPRLDPLERWPHRTTTGAHRLYLEGRLFLGRHTPADIATALARFEAAIDEDPGYAPAWGALAEGHQLLGTIGASSADHYEPARRAARRAIALDAELPEAACVLGAIAWNYDWDWDGAQTIFEDALRANPNRADLHIGYSDYCCYLKQPTRAIEHAEAALAIDPVSPWVNTLLAQALFMAGQGAAAVAQSEKTLELTPGFPFAHFMAGLARIQDGDYAAAIVDIQSALASGRQDFVAALGMCFGMAGRTEEAAGILTQMQAMGDAVPPIGPAVVHLGLGQFDEARAEFERCIAERDWHVLLLHGDPTVSRLGARPELQGVLDVLALPAGEATAN